MVKSILVRCDADPRSGFGHFSRCLNLARGIKELEKDSEVVFWGVYNPLARELIKKFKMKFINPSNDSNELLRRARDHSHFILDHYDIDQSVIDGFCGQAFKFVKIDDFNDLILDQVDLVVNFRFNISREVYKAKKVCVGVEYLPVRKEFESIREKNRVFFPKDINTAVLFMGGTDRGNVGQELAQIVAETIPKATIKLIIGQSIKENTLSFNNRIVHIPMSYDLDKLFREADVMITGGGLTKYECGYCCIPNATLSQTSGQDQDTKELAKIGVTYDLGSVDGVQFHQTIFSDRVKEFLSVDVRKKIYEATKLKFVTGSTSKVVHAVLSV